MYCLGCDYHLQRLNSPMCPECMKQFDADDDRTYGSFPGRDWRRRQYGFMVVAIILVAFGMVASHRNHDHGSMMLLVLLSLPAVTSMATGIAMRRSRPSPVGTLLACTPAGFIMVMISTLAIHMHMSLGGWPVTIGMDGFSDALVAHADVGLAGFWLLTLTSLLCSFLLLAFLCTRRSRQWVYQLGVFMVANSLMFALFQLAPDRFLAWWWD